MLLSAEAKRLEKAIAESNSLTLPARESSAGRGVVNRSEQYQVLLNQSLCFDHPDRCDAHLLRGNTLPGQLFLTGISVSI